MSIYIWSFVRSQILYKSYYILCSTYYTSIGNLVFHVWFSCVCHLVYVRSCLKVIKNSTAHIKLKTKCVYIYIYIYIYSVFNLKVARILIWVIYLLRFTTSYITQLTCTYSKCWKWCPFISMHLSTCFAMFFATFLSVLSFFNHFRNSTFYWRLSSKFFKETLSTVGVRHRF